MQKVGGGDAEMDVVKIPRAYDYLVAKQGGNLKYGDFDLQMGIHMAKPVKDWIDASLAMNFMRKSGEVQAADFKRDVRHIRAFDDALLTEIGFPGGDANAKDAAFLTLKFKPWRVRNKKGTGEKVEQPADMGQKQWLASDFRFGIDGLAEAFAKAAKVEAITYKQSAVVDGTGTDRDYLHEPGAVELSNLKVTTSAELAMPLWDWHEKFVIDGVNEAGAHKAGSMVYLNRTRQKELLTLTFSEVGIFKMSATANTNNEDKIAQVTAEFYFERLETKYGV
jgi:hypothetical protein